MSLIPSLLTSALADKLDAAGGRPSPLGTLAKDVLLGTLINQLVAQVPTDIADPGAGGAIPVTRSGTVRLVTAAAEARTLADPEVPGLRLALLFQTDGGDCTITAAHGIDKAGHTVITHDTAGECVHLEAIVTAASTYRWRVVANLDSTPIT